MKNFRNNFRKNRFRGNGDRNFKRNGGIQKFDSGYGDISEFNKKKINRNNNASKLAEKYTTLAKEALTNGDKILSENYFQHADHFNRIIEKQSLVKQEKKTFENQNGLQANDNENSNNNIEAK